MNARARLMVLAAAAAGALLTGCGTTPAGSPAGAASSGAAPGSSPASAAASASGASGTSAAPGGPAAPGAAAAPWCTASGLVIAYTGNAQIRNGALAGMSHADTVVTLTNTGHAACRTAGYPGVAALDAAGRQVQQAARAPGAAPVLTLAPGQVASALISGNTASCTTVSAVGGFLVTAPDQRTSTRLGPAGSMCLNSLQVHPLAAGDSGGLRL